MPAAGRAAAAFAAVRRGALGGLIVCAALAAAGGARAGDEALSRMFRATAFIPDCARTRGGVAIAAPPAAVFYCPRRVRAIERAAPGAAFFFLVHEIGHLALDSGNERAVDCWAAGRFPALAGGWRQMRAAIRFVAENTRADSRYGDGRERAARLRRCSRNATPADP